MSYVRNDFGILEKFQIPDAPVPHADFVLRPAKPPVKRKTARY